MATRFYLPSTGEPASSPTFGAGWADTAGATRREMVRSRISSAFAEADRGAGGAGATQFELIRQYVSSETLQAQTLTGTIKGVIRARETHAGAQCDLAIRVAVCAGDGTNIRQVLAVTSEDAVAGAGNNTGAAPEFNISAGTSADLQNRRFETGTATYDLTLTSTAIDAGDRLIVEIGYGDQSTSTTRYGIVECGDSHASDLAENQTGTDQYNPWVEFSADITFGAAAENTIDQWMSRYEVRQGVKAHMVPSGMTPPDRIDA